MDVNLVGNRGFRLIIGCFSPNIGHFGPNIGRFDSTSAALTSATFDQTSAALAQHRPLSTVPKNNGEVICLDPSRLVTPNLTPFGMDSVTLKIDFYEITRYITC